MDDAANDSTAHCTMKLNRDKATFGRHETFPLRYGWLPKGLEALEHSPAIFSQPEQAMITLGVGRNMVNAIQACSVDTIQRRRSWFRNCGESRRSRPISVPHQPVSVDSVGRCKQPNCVLSLPHFPSVEMLPHGKTQRACPNE